MLALLPAAVLLASSFTGQVVCSACWFEADRAKVAYGTEADLDCAKKCAGEGIGQSLAVKDAAGAYTLYALEARALPGGKGALLNAVAASVEIEGELRREGEKPVLRVDTMRVLPASAPPPTAPAAAGPLVLRDLSGFEQRLDALRGRIVVLNFWATWCKPCVEEMPDLAALQSRYGAWGVQVVGAAVDGAEGRDAVLGFLKKSRVGFPIWLGATTAQMESYGLPPVLPGTVVFDREGKVVAKFAGRVAPDKIAAALDRLLKQPAAIAAAAPHASVRF
jgi:thiol-disulfide isomerase/thioredoxin